MWVAVREVDFSEGRLPSVCVKTGARGDHVLRVSFRTYPRWTLLLLFCGVVPFFIAYLFTRKIATGVVPMSAAALVRLRRAQATAAALIVAGLALLVAGSRVWPLSISGLIAGSAGLAVLLFWTPQLTVAGAIVVDEVHPGRSVILSRVHPAFRRAVEQQGRALGSGE
jgi:hypothetical protein